MSSQAVADHRVEGIELRFGVSLEHFGVGVPVNDDRPGRSRRRRFGRRDRDQALEFGGWISGHHEPRVGTRRQAEPVLYL